MGRRGRRGYLEKRIHACLPLKAALVFNLTLGLLGDVVQHVPAENGETERHYYADADEDEPYGARLH